MHVRAGSVEDDEEAARELIAAMMQGDFLSLAVSLLERLKEPEDSQGVHHILGLPRLPRLASRLCCSWIECS